MADHEPPLRDARWRQQFRKALLTWYQDHARDLPWRQTQDPYRIWISEIMLQQTTVAAVKPYYSRFLQRFPTVSALAVADEQEVLRLWEGLGYYSRARNLHRAARRIVEQNDGRFPEDVAGLLELPGIGRYTAGAIASFAFQKPAPIVEANTLRLYSRLLGYDGDPKSRSGQKLLWRFAGELLPREGAGPLNQALMELGSLLCTPNEPSCTDCPVRKSCRAREAGTQHEIPRPSARPVITQQAEFVIAIRHSGTWLLIQRGLGERWAGLWDFPRISPEMISFSSEKLRSKRAAGLTARQRKELESAVRTSYGLPVSLGDEFLTFAHSVTRYRIELSCLDAELQGQRQTPCVSGAAQWMTIPDLETLPLSMPARRIARSLPKQARGLFPDDGK